MIVDSEKDYYEEFLGKHPAETIKPCPFCGGDICRGASGTSSDPEVTFAKWQMQMAKE